MWGNVPANVRGNNPATVRKNCDNVRTFRQMSGECSSICFGVCRSSSGICLEFGFVGVLTAVVWNSPGNCLEFFLLCGVLSGICGVWLAFSGLVASMVL
ncbi:unnamed protein product [Meloidogyne enterolobii]|uniref:Uncharacterized protein n=1 Tax=Meloidogyne enterolobii TaxID=390850 RepID=A0ACB1A5M8_MELEN